MECTVTMAVMKMMILVVGLVVASVARAQEWRPILGKPLTRWAKDVKPENVWPEHPRPTMSRERWMNLNGLWSFVISKDSAPNLKELEGHILVPFPPESALSGVGRIVQPDETLRYSRDFTIPDDWKGQRVLLHFGAVDWSAAVEVNGKPVGEHKGGYDPFTFDVTDALKPGLNQVEVSVKDPTDTGGQPRGKQWLKPHGIWYTPTSGIWQTVWLEPVPPEGRITNVRFRPIAAERQVEVEVGVEGAGSRDECNVTVIDGVPKTVIGRGAIGKPVRVALESPRMWTPETPETYHVIVSIRRNGVLLDTVHSYFAFREIAVAKDDKGINRLMLNGKPVFHFGPLDQGFWPDGLYTPPSEAAMRFDIEAVKKMGGNMLRKHVKVEPERFYYLCDTLGVMVWQDMPSPFFKGTDPKDTHPPLTDEWKANFEREWLAIMKSLERHPSIVMWVPFNEGWGQTDLEWCKRVVKMTQDADPTRLVNNASGWTDMKVGHVSDVHEYPGPGMAAVEESRASVLGEFGGLGLPVEGHTWVDKNNWGYVSYKSKEELTDAYVDLLKQTPLLIGRGLCAAVYTQTSDVEIECNGWLTYDREVWKIDPARASEAAAALYRPPPTVTAILPRAGEGEAATWRFTTDMPGDDWVKPGFEDESWRQGRAGFGTRGTPGAVVGTEWKSGEIWIRRSFDLPASKLEYPHLAIHHDEDAEVYINGEKAAELKRWTTGYRLIPLSAAASKLLKPGGNTIAIHCKQTSGGQYIDCGLVDVRTTK
jgi:hypothetical protein